jgi:DNA-binding Lrp family transcriptional regulator
MVMGFTMIKVLPGHEDESCLALKNAKGVKEVFSILGEYQLFVIVHAENIIDLQKLIKAIKNMAIVTEIWHVLVSEKEFIMHAEISPEANILGKSACLAI